MIVRASIVIFLASCSSPGSGQESRPASVPLSRPDSRAVVMAEVVNQLREKGVELDPVAKTATISAQVLVTEDFLEFFLIGKRGKSHESLFRTQVKASVLNAALIALGYAAGSNVDYKEKVPMPTMQQVQEGADTVDVIRPKGMEVFISVEWKDADGKMVRHRAEELWIDVSREEKPPKAAKWIYFGGQMAPLLRNEPPVFVADYEENFIALCYMKPDNHLITIEHQNARDDKIWWANQKLLPERGTEVRMIFSTKPLQ